MQSKTSPKLEESPPKSVLIAIDLIDKTRIEVYLKEGEEVYIRFYPAGLNVPSPTDVTGFESRLLSAPLKIVKDRVDRKLSEDYHLNFWKSMTREDVWKYKMPDEERSRRGAYDLIVRLSSLWPD